MELLRTPRLLLRRWADDDLAAYFAVYSQWDVMRWLGAPPTRSRSAGICTRRTSGGRVEQGAGRLGGEALPVAGISTVLALTDPDNTASQAVARRLGMTDQGLTDRWFTITTRQFTWFADRLGDRRRSP